MPSLLTEVHGWFLTWWRAFVTMYKFCRLGIMMVSLQASHMMLARMSAFVAAFFMRVDPDDERAALTTMLRIIAKYRRKAIDQVFIDTTVANLRSTEWSDAPIFTLIDGPDGDAVSSLTKVEAIDLINDVAQAVGYFLWKNLDTIGSVGERSPTAASILCPVAILLPSSADYFPVCYGVSRSSVWVNVLESCSRPATRQAPSPAVYHHACAALINTNVASNDALYAALVTAAATVLIIDETMVPLLFAERDLTSSRAAALRVPAHVRTILLWKATATTAARGREHMLHLFSSLTPWIAGDAPASPSSANRPSSNGATVVGCDLFADIIAPARGGLGGATLPLHEGDARVLRLLLRDGVASPRSKARRLFGAPLSFLAVRRCASLFATLQLTDPMLMIFTSGTTGLPKAAKFSHLRYHAAIMLSRVVVGPNAILRRLQQGGGSRSTLTVYNALPTYHSAGGVFCPAHLIHYLELQTAANAGLLRRLRCVASPRSGTARMVIRRKFTASGFGKDLERFKVTVVQYIGELLRFALEAKGADALEPPPLWRVPFAFGNGLRADVWAAAKQRFGIVRIAEFYASTEGNVGFCNYFDENFAVGHIPVFPWPFYGLSPHNWRVFPMVFLKFDTAAEEPVRIGSGAASHCVRGRFNEPCEVVGVVTSGFDPLGLRRFDGYLGDRASTARKLIHNVLRRGDTFFRTGDLLRFDRSGFVYFVDRIGDTYRWKGENVSTSEVANALCTIKAWPVSVVAGKTVDGTVSVWESVVFGVSVPQHEGRAGMARLSLVVSPATLSGADRAAVATAFVTEHLAGLVWAGSRRPSSLPAYAVPVFCRVEVVPSPSAFPSSDFDPGSSAAGDEMTATFKHRKQVHQRLGLNPDPTGTTSLFVLRPAGATRGQKPPADAPPHRYVPLSEEDAATLEKGDLPPGYRW